MSTEPNEVDFHFDVMCPWAYQTSKWIRNVREQNALTINWKFFSLEEVNLKEGKKHPWERDWSYGWSMMRIGAILRRQSMDDLDRWYERSGRALHEEGKQPHDPNVARQLLEDIGMDPQIVDQSLEDLTTHDEIKQDHERVISAGGYGVPTLFFGDHALYGPVLIKPPKGDAAMKLWTAVTSWLEFPYLYEMQKPKTKDDEKQVFETFRPYLEARDWVSINRGEVIEFDDKGENL
ncbi:MAG: DsbA family protein [Acidimicrobiales bacterium]|jgi:2-hydroxychromene-2-carboxylate isomerase|nr:DsbA family protein [Acidimicrobiales bacterium]MDP6298578.1 DsbA family protein [Acidimicrobiales bacterium]HJM29113.1 DsbA family protein [Acidimicrobiales bacterium]HJM97429.1 DsbA family protein [Acidimicrobiales bacterium]